MTHRTNPSVGVVGFEIWVETFLDLATATLIKFNCKKPDKTMASFTATAFDKTGPRSNTRRGARYVTTAASDLDQAGEWEVQVVPTMPGFNGPGMIAKFTVEAAL